VQPKVEPFPPRGKLEARQRLDGGE